MKSMEDEVVDHREISTTYDAGIVTSLTVDTTIIMDIACSETSMALLMFRILVLLICLIFYEEVRAYASFIETYCQQHGKILNCDFSFHKQESSKISEGQGVQNYRESREMLLLNFGNTFEINKIFISNFPTLAVGNTACADMNIKNSNITFKETSVEQCPRKRIEIRCSSIDRIPGDVSHLVTYSSNISVLQNIHLKFTSIHDSRIKSVSKLGLSSSEVSFFDSRVSFSDTFVVEESSSVKFINSIVTFNEGSYVEIHGELTLQGTTVDAKYIHLNPSSKIYIQSPEAHWLHDKSNASGNFEEVDPDERGESESSDTRSKGNRDTGEQTPKENYCLFLTPFIIFLVLFIITVLILLTIITLRRRRLRMISARYGNRSPETPSELRPLENTGFSSNSATSQVEGFVVTFK